MPGTERSDAALERWLSGDGLAAIDGVTGGALDVVAVVDRALNVRYINWTAPALTRETVVTMSALDLMPPGNREIAHEVMTRTLRTGVGESFETFYRDEHGVMVWMVRVGPIRHDGEVIGLVTINTDVTEQRRADVDRDRFFSLSLDMLVVIAPGGHLKRINPAFGKMLGYDVAELIGKPFIEFVHPEDEARTIGVFANVQAGLIIDDFENRYRRRDGTYRVLSWRGTVDPLTGYVHAVARDITEQRAVEAQLRHAQKMEAVGQLAGGIAHDFNNLMQAVLGNAELAILQATPLPAVLDHLYEIADAGQRAADLTKQLLTFSRRQPMHPVSIDLNILLQRLMKLLHRLLPENIAVKVYATDGLATVSADPTQVEQVIINLCVNARDAMERGGVLSIETDNVLIEQRDCELYPWAKPGRFVRLSVTDTGVGMTAEVRDRVFEPFFTTKSNQRGTGLGLATVYGIVQQHGGLIHVNSELGRGTTFKICLPADERVAQQTDPRDAMDEAHVGGLETILVAEDELLVRRPLIQLLERAGYRTLAAVNGLEAIRLLSEHPTVDLVMLDVVMPELGGPQAWAQMQQMRPDLHVIFTSGYADERYRELLPDDADVLEKPFRTKELLHAVRRKLDVGSSSST
jgi:two-component system, cell cycle sensor histidine kinase and response regulator CckA